MLDILTALHEVAIEPVTRAAAIYDASRLILVPHEVLIYMPFGALRDGTTGRYLAEDLSLLRVPSGGALVALRDRNHSDAGSAVGPGQVTAPLPDRLPATRAEARAVSARLPDAHVLMGSDATEGRFRRGLADGGLLHLATHSPKL